MFSRIQQYPLISAEGRVFRPRAYGNPRPEGIWDGWLVFFPADGGAAIASDRETAQPSFHALMGWAAALSGVYLAGVLERALRIAEQPSILAELAQAEYNALEDAEQLETAAELKRASSAQADEQIAASARADARSIRRERVATEETAAALEETAATLERAAHEQSATEARAAASDAGRRRRKAKKEAK